MVFPGVGVGHCFTGVSVGHFLLASEWDSVLLASERNNVLLVYGPCLTGFTDRTMLTGFTGVRVGQCFTGFTGGTMFYWRQSRILFYRRQCGTQLYCHQSGTLQSSGLGFALLLRRAFFYRRQNETILLSECEWEWDITVVRVEQYYCLSGTLRVSPLHCALVYVANNFQILVAQFSSLLQSSLSLVSCLK